MTAPRPSARYQEPTPITAANLGDLRVSLLLQGESGGGKTHMLCSMPQPIVVGYTDPNLSVPESYIREGRNITLYPLRTWTDFEWFVRRTKNREWDASTVALDSYTFMGDRLVLEKMEEPGATKGDGNLKIQMWNHVKNDQWQLIMDLCSATSTLPGKPSYHVVVTIHEREEYERSVMPSNSGGEPTVLQKLVGISPAVPGSLRDGFGRMFDCVFIAQERPRLEKVGNINKVVGADHVLWTVSPDGMRHVKDGVGGKCGRNTLPPTVENTWESLTKAWGLK